MGLVSKMDIFSTFMTHDLVFRGVLLSEGHSDAQLDGIADLERARNDRKLYWDEVERKSILSTVGRSVLAIFIGLIDFPLLFVFRDNHFALWLMMTYTITFTGFSFEDIIWTMFAGFGKRFLEFIQITMVKRSIENNEKLLSRETANRPAKSHESDKPSD